MKNLFNSIKLTKPRSNVFDLTHDVKLSLNMGQLVPICVMEAVPGDKFSIGTESLVRFAPLVSPVMHRMDVSFHYFFVPNRLVWPNWEKFITNTPLSDTGQLPAFPHFIMDDTEYTPLADYMGIPTPEPLSQPENISALPFAAYQCIYNEYYRDQNLQAEIDYKLVDGVNGDFLTKYGILRRRAWEHDYFTAALPWAQKGPAVDIPLGEVRLLDSWDETQHTPSFRLDTNSGGDPIYGDLVAEATDGNINTSTFPGAKAAYDPDGTLEVGATTITDLRRAFRLQEWLERNARGGTRYVENILSHFGVRSSDKRLQRPEYITGTKSPVVISEILNTTGTEELPQGNMAGHAVSVTSGKFGSYFCEEHGYIIGIMSVMPKTAYQQGIPKHFLKVNDPFEYFWPSFAHIGEQEVKVRELYGFNIEGNNTFGYVPRYAEYKFQHNRVAGDFRTTLNYWHLGRIFSTPPNLNEEFVQCTPSDRIFAVTDPGVQKLYATVLNRIKAVRRMPKFGNPQF